MNGSHLPAGQSMPGAAGPAPGHHHGGPHAHSHNGGSGRRRPPQQQYPSHHHQQPHYQYPQQHQQQHMNPMYAQQNYMNPYAPSYYPQMPPQAYYNGGMPAAHMPYNPYQQRSPVLHQHQHHQPQHLQQQQPPMQHHQPQQYPPVVSSSMHQPPIQHYQRPPPPQMSPAPVVSTPPPYYPATQAQAPPIPHTPSSTHSSQVVPAQSTPPTPHTNKIAPSPPEAEARAAPIPFKFPLPWLSHPNEPFPARPAKTRRRRRAPLANSARVELPTNQQVAAESLDDEPPTEESAAELTPKTSTVSTNPVVPAESVPASELSQKSSDAPAAARPASGAVSPTQSTKPANRAAIPALPIVPVFPKPGSKETKSGPAAAVAVETAEAAQAVPSAEGSAPSGEQPAAAPAPESAPAPAWSAPRLWAGLFGQAGSSAGSAVNHANNGTTGGVNGDHVGESAGASGEASAAGGFTRSNATSLAEALDGYRVNGGEKIAFLEPRGLINTGNMCYMNSVLQALIFCLPFYDFLDQVSKKAAYSFKSETPLIDAMIMFMREYKVIDSAVSVDQLRRRLKNEELEQYGESFTPEFVYDAIRKLPRFASMRRGHQQDAEEFLGFLLESLHEECNAVMRHLPEANTSSNVPSSTGTPQTSSPTSTVGGSDWLEVGRKQRAAVTRSSGHTAMSSPVTKLFGGQLRSELRVPGLKDSVTMEPFQPLQLDIGSPQVHNIVDALKNLTKPETLHGDFNSPRGRNAVATKQVFIESLPPVLILHLKRFQFDAEGTGTIKIWKKVGYPLELDLPKEVLSRQKRNAILAEGAGFPKYRLIAAVYHHGKNASGGHYTVDLRRQEGREWIRLDDTVIRRVRSEDVAEGGSEDDPTATTSNDKKDATAGGSINRFEGIGDEDTGDEGGWSAPVNGAKKWANVANGGAKPAAASAPKGKQMKENIRDNKVAYLLFYQRV
ncbi:hypothetical protein Micbo1qcDRAFT_205162 [Microdochium bolleyi]|uniref:ubiquitinyl hydrolase 1 n=1 Tax=Microdochium bolleyi TaxID=196109 RepID=A0A136J240_9PEZI|nr:hypothetical protein Micbo1qcDRAFT_205162 [Microdochium bolleyi]